LIYLGVLGIGFGLDAVMEPVSLPSSVAVPVGAASLIAGAGLLGSFLRAFRRARTPVDPYARYLERKFATAYGDYKRRVRRWM
jgi:protein-S-isoprenylcysteine O-methyltransferase Ste14